VRWCTLALCLDFSTEPGQPQLSDTAMDDALNQAHGLQDALAAISKYLGKESKKAQRENDAPRIEQYRKSREKVNEARSAVEDVEIALEDAKTALDGNSPTSKQSSTGKASSVASKKASSNAAKSRPNTKRPAENKASDSTKARPVKKARTTCGTSNDNRKDTAASSGEQKPVASTTGSKMNQKVKTKKEASDNAVIDKEAELNLFNWLKDEDGNG